MLIPLPPSPDVSVLNCGAGDMTFSFDEKDPLECARAERVVKDMLKRGYLLFAKVDGEYTRVHTFDEKRREYVIADGPESAPAASDPPPSAEPEPKVVKRGRGRPRRIPAKGTPVTAVAPTAGG